MKKLIIAAVILIGATVQSFAIGITIQCKSNYDRDSRSCFESTRGLCMIISAFTTPSANTFNGNISYDRSQGIVLTFSKSKDMTRTIFSTYFSGENFLVDGDSQISPEVLTAIKYPYVSTGFVIKEGKYKYSINGDIITVVIPVNEVK
jgi:hypothetical protein